MSRPEASRTRRRNRNAEGQTRMLAEQASVLAADRALKPPRRTFSFPDSQWYSLRSETVWQQCVEAKVFQGGPGFLSVYKE
jgi:hypothetical protein